MGSSGGRQCFGRQLHLQAGSVVVIGDPKPQTAILLRFGNRWFLRFGVWVRVQGRYFGVQSSRHTGWMRDCFGFLEGSDPGTLNSKPESLQH